MPQISKALKYSYDIQDLTYNSLMSLKDQMTDESGKLTCDKTIGKTIADLVKAHVMIQERVSFHRRTPNPGTLRPEPKSKRKPIGVWSRVQAVEQPAIEVQPQAQLPAPPAPEPTPQ